MSIVWKNLVTQVGLSFDDNIVSALLIPLLLESGHIEELLPDAELLRLGHRVRQLDAGRLRQEGCS